MHSAVLLALAYGDLFDYPLRRDELLRYLPVAASGAQLDRALERLVPTAVSQLEEGFYCLRGREATGRLRAERAAASDAGWRQARRFARWLAHVPFVRMVAVCGSLAVDNAGRDGDVDLFLITAPRRLWLVQATTMILRRLARRPGAPPLCPNYLLTGDDLEVSPCNLYLAHETIQARPLWGHAYFRRFRAANAWTEAFLPQARVAAVLEPPPDAPTPAAEPVPTRLVRALAWLLGGWLGDVLDAALHRLLLRYYRLRLRRYGLGRDEIARAYRRERQIVITGGYLDAIEARYRARAAAVVDDAALVTQSFHGSETPETVAPRIRSRYGDIFDRRYGGAR